MPFPFVAPFQPWVQKTLEIRENNPMLGMNKKPFIVMCSGAKVLKGGTRYETKEDREKQLEGIIKFLSDPKNQYGSNGPIYYQKDENTQSRLDIDANKIYDGCIITNNINDLSLSYSTNETIVGKDFRGNLIKVEGESGKKISTPIIESLSIMTAGTNHTLKQAIVKVRCFSLKQLEYFELFFMKPHNHVLIEWGDSTFLSKIFSKDKAEIQAALKDDIANQLWIDGDYKPVNVPDRIEDVLIHNKAKNFDEFISEYVGIYSTSFDNAKSYYAKIYQSLGTYDYLAGIVANFSFSIDNDGTYECEITIKQANQFSMSIPLSNNKTSSKSGNANSGTTDPYEKLINQIAFNFRLDDKLLTDLIKGTPHPEAKEGEKDSWKRWLDDDIFNINITKEQVKQSKVSSEAYISLRFIIYILCNYVSKSKNSNDTSFQIRSPKWYVNDDTKNIKEFTPIPIVNNLISSSDLVIFPSSKLPVFQPYIKVEDGKRIGSVGLKEKESKDGKIGQYELHIPDCKKLRAVDGSSYEYTVNNDTIIGNALNIFVKYDMVSNVYSQEVFKIDFIDKILSVINQNSYGVFNLIIAPESAGAKGVMVLYDTKIQDISTKTSPKVSEFRFKIGPKKSIITDFSFDFEQSQLMAAQQIFQSSTFLIKATDQYKALLKEKNADKSKVLQTVNTNQLKTLARMVDKSMYANADGYWAIDWLGYKNESKRLNDLKEQLEKESNVSNNPGQVTAKDPAAEEENNDATASERKDKEITNEINNQINDTLIKFYTKDKKKIIPMIFKDEDVIRQILSIEEDLNPAKSIITPIKVTFTIDGFSGLRPGYTFNMDGVPEIYNKAGKFRITNVKHDIDDEQWKTSIEASYSPSPRKPV